MILNNAERFMASLCCLPNDVAGIQMRGPDALKGRLNSPLMLSKDAQQYVLGLVPSL